jgi:hypothetical protein
MLFKKASERSLCNLIMEDLYSLSDKQFEFSVIGHSCKMKIGMLSKGLILSIELSEDKLLQF